MSQPYWVSCALIAINRLPGRSPDDMARKTLARRIVRLCEVDAEGFPVPTVTRAADGTIQMTWINDTPGHQCRLDVMISRGRSFRAKIWYPAAIRDTFVVSRDWAEWSRRMFATFWPSSCGHSADDIFQELPL